MTSLLIVPHLFFKGGGEENAFIVFAILEDGANVSRQRLGLLVATTNIVKTDARPDHAINKCSSLLKEYLFLIN